MISCGNGLIWSCVGWFEAWLCNWWCTDTNLTLQPLLNPPLNLNKGGARILNMNAFIKASLQLPLFGRQCLHLERRCDRWVLCVQRKSLKKRTTPPQNVSQKSNIRWTDSLAGRIFKDGWPPFFGCLTNLKSEPASMKHNITNTRLTQSQMPNTPPTLKYQIHHS